MDLSKRMRDRQLNYNENLLIFEIFNSTVYFSFLLKNNTRKR